MANILNYRKPGGSEWVVGGTQTINGQLTLGAGSTFKLNTDAQTASSNAVTTTAQGGVVTTESLTTAAAATQAITINKAGVVASDQAFANVAGGTNTRAVIVQSVVCATGTITVTLRNIEASNALNGTVKFNWHYQKA